MPFLDSIFAQVPVNPEAEDLRRRAAIARSIILGTPIEEPPGPDQSNLSAFGRNLASRLTGGIVDTYRDLPAMPSIDPSQLDADQRRRYDARSKIERGLAETPHPEAIRHYSGELLKSLFPAKEYQAIRSGDRAVLYNPNDPTDLHPIEETYNLSPGAGHYVGTERVAEQPATAMDPISRVNMGIQAGTLTAEQGAAMIAKLTQLTAPPMIVIPSSDGSMTVAPRRPGMTFPQASTAISQADRAKAGAAWNEFSAFLKSNPQLLTGDPNDAVTAFGLLKRRSDPEAVSHLKLDPRYEQIFANETPLGAPTGALPNAGAPAAALSPRAGNPTVIENAVDAVTRLKVDPKAALGRAGQLLGRTLSPEEQQQILTAGQTPAAIPALPPPAAVVTPDQGGYAPGMASPVETGSARQETLLRQRLTTETDPQARAAIVERIRALHTGRGGASRGW